MDSSSGYGSWNMQTNSNPELAWQYASNDVPQPAGSSSMQSMNAPSTSSSGIQNALHPTYLGLEGQAMQQLLQSYQQQQPPQANYQPQMYPQSYVIDPSRTAMPASNAFPVSSLYVNANTFHDLQAAYPNAPPEVLIQAIFHSPQPQAQQQHMLSQHQSPADNQLAPPPSTSHVQPPPSYPQPPSHYEPFRSHSDNSLANALNFQSPSPLPANVAPNPTINPAQPTLPSVAPSASPSNDAASTPAISSGADTEKKPTKLRQIKLTDLPGVAQSVNKKETPPAAAVPSAAANMANTSSDGTPLSVVVDSGSEPGTPPLPRAKVLAVKPSANGTTSSAATAKSNAVATPAEVRKLSDKAKAFLTRLRVEQEPQKAARNLVECLSDLAPDGSFLRPRPTSAEDRKIIIEALNSIAKLEIGKGYTDSGRKRFFAALMALPAARQILAAWLRATAPPKKVTEAVPDHSRRYRDTLFPLLNILEYVEIRKVYLTDDAGLGKAMTGVSSRAVDPSARTLATNIKAKWTKVVNDEDAKKAARTTLSTSASTSTAAAASAKRKPGESATSAESVKRYKSATAVPTASTSARTPKVAAAPSSSTTAKPALSFFGAGNTRRPTSASSSSAKAASGSRMNAHQDIMILVNKLSGGDGNERSAAGQAKSPSAEAQKKTKVRKSVRFKEDHELEAIRLIEPADYGQGDEEQVEDVEARKDEGLALRQTVSTMEALMEWREPREVEVTVAESAPLGSESVEGPFQTQRKASLEAKVYPEGNEPDSPDESQLEQPGTISETPEELLGAETKDIPLPNGWSEEFAAATEATEEEQGVKEEQDVNEGDIAMAEAGVSGRTSTETPPMAGLGELLSRVGQAIGANGGTMVTSETESVAAPAPAPAPTLNLDVNQLQAIIRAANGNGSPANAVNATMASSNVTSDNLSSLLSSLSRSNGLQTAPAPAPAVSSSEAPEHSSYWQQTYRSNGASNVAQREESYPGEYQQDYKPARQH
ncbi:hypothetical protein [Sporisorium scitamineum]|uniref:Uncharacterized protein n=1 Tax=Sporisorium scitamineum TaxID=49012 RepID=A0A0F7RVR9_9BASI|nr:hypothetical protein [Sporisorium scitamineum]